MNTAPSLPARAGDTTREHPWPLALLTRNIKTYVDRMSPLWVEGQVVEYNQRPGTRMSFFVLRDLEADVSMSVTAFRSVLDQVGTDFTEGTRVVARVKPVFWEKRGSLNLQAAEIHLLGLGELLARIEQLRRQLTAEGVFAADRKKPLPFLPRRVGLICGRNSKAERDVVVNARTRWPGVDFVIREVAVQGPSCVREVTSALIDLDHQPEVDVIVIARGGGAVEDLLPFSEERLVRAVANATTPVVSAIGHETDAPLLDLVADYRASTPTDAARRIVPDLEQELGGLTQTRERMRQVLLARLNTASAELAQLRARPVLADPNAAVRAHQERLTHLQDTLRLAIRAIWEREQAGLTGARATLRALSPLRVLERGYSILRLPDGTVITNAAAVKKGDLLEGILAEGRLVATVFGTTPATPAASPAPPSIVVAPAPPASTQVQQDSHIEGETEND